MYTLSFWRSHLGIISIDSTPFEPALIPFQVFFNSGLKIVSQSNPSIQRSCTKILKPIKIGETHRRGSKSFDASDRTTRLVTMSLYLYWGSITNEKLSERGVHLSPRVLVTSSNSKPLSLAAHLLSSIPADLTTAINLLRFDNAWFNVSAPLKKSST